jgi:hypothetical protein
MALVNQQGVSNGTGPVGFANPALYSLATTNYSNDFHGMADATSNNLNGNNNLYPSVAGYNLATGWGSPNGQNLINDLAPVVSINTPTPIPTSAPVPIANLNWSSMTSMLSNRSNFSVGVVNGILYAIGGQNGVTVTNEMDEFIPSSYNPGANNFHYQQLVPTYRFVFLMEFFTQSDDLTEVLICLKWRPIIQPPTLA